MVREVVADLRGERGGGALLADVDAGALLDLLAQGGRGRLELDQRAEHVEQHRPDRAHAIHSHAANCVVKRPSPTADAAVTGTVHPRSSLTTASHMNSGNRTARKRGSDMSG